MNEIELKNRAQRLLDRVNALGFSKDGKPMVIDQAYELVAAGEGLRNQHVLRVMAKKATMLDAATATFAQGVYAAGYKPGNYIPPLVLPRNPDEKIIEALLVSYGPDFDHDEIGFAFEQWRLLMEEAAKRAGTEPITSESESAAERAWTDIINRLRMTDREEILHLEGFIRESGLMGEFAKYAARVEAEQTGFLSRKASAEGPVGHRDSLKVEAAPSTADDAIIAFLERIGFEVKESDLHRPFWECGNVGSNDFETEAEAWDDAYLTALLTAAQALDIKIEELLALPSAQRLKALERFNPYTLERMLDLLTSCKFEFKTKNVNRRRKVTAWRYLPDVYSARSASSMHRAVAEAWHYAKAKLGLPEAILDDTPFEAQLVMLEAALTGQVKNAWKDRAAENERQKGLADEAYENFTFPSEVVESSGWESWSGSGLFRRPVFLATADGEDTRKVIFEVKVTGDTVKASISNA